MKKKKEPQDLWALFIISLIAIFLITYLIGFVQSKEDPIYSLSFAVMMSGLLVLLAHLRHRYVEKGMKTFLGIPYDFSRPTMKRIKERCWNPDKKLFKPKVWGWGWTFNWRNPWSTAIVIGLVVTLLMLLRYS